MPAYYSEFDAKAAAWLRELIKRGLIADGDVDERDLWDVSPDDLRGYTQVHLCAGIGVWSYALRRAGWADDRPVWTGSFPCQPFSAAGKGGGFADERHLWPAGCHLIGECRPPVVFGEQVASKDAEPWLDLVQADLEAVGYALGAVPFPSAGVGAPHIRDRLYWVADAVPAGRPERRAGAGLVSAAGRGGLDWLADDDDPRLEGRRQPGRERAAERPAGAGVLVGGLADTDGGHAGAERQQPGGEQRQQPQDGGTGGLGNAPIERPTDQRVGNGQGSKRPAQQFGAVSGAASGIGERTASKGGAEPAAGGDRTSRLARNVERPGPVNGIWRDADWLFCRDGKWRPVEPSTFPLAHGAAARVGRLRGYGNAINAEAATAWVESYIDAEADLHRVRLIGVFS